MERHLLIGGSQAQGGEAMREPLEGDHGFEASERRTDAEVDAASERERAARVRALGVERVRVREDTGVSYACRGMPVGDAVSSTTTTSGLGRASCSRSYPTHAARGPVSPSGRAKTRSAK